MDDIRKLFHEAADDGDAIDRDGFQRLVEDPTVQLNLSKLGVDLEPHTVPGLFSIFDFHGEGKINIDEFTFGIERLHGQARSIDLVRLMHQHNRLEKKINAISNKVWPDRKN